MLTIDPSKQFASAYFEEFVTVIAEGCSGGLYGDVIEVEYGKEGTFCADDITKFIRFQHGDNDYNDSFLNYDQYLRNNVKEIAARLLDLLDDPSYKKSVGYWVEYFPHIRDNIRSSLINIMHG